MLSWICHNLPWDKLSFLLTVLLTAIVGLFVWRRQLIEKANHEFMLKEFEEKRELAKKVLVITYQIRDAIQSVRHPLQLVQETTAAISYLKMKNNLTDEQVKALDTSIAVIQMRWEKATEAMTSLELEMPQLEASLGSNSLEALADLKGCVRTLYANLLSWTDHKNNMNALDKTFRDSLHEVIYDSGDKNTFTIRLLNAVRKVEGHYKEFFKIPFRRE